MKKSVKCAVLSVLMVCVFVFSLPLTAFAADNYKMNINEPAKGDNQGYILLLVEGPSGTRQVQCISWTLLGTFDADSTFQSTQMDITVSNSSATISFFGYGGGYDRISCGFGRSLSGDSSRTTYWSSYDSQVINYQYTLGSNTVLGYQVYGNGFVSSHDLGSNNNIPFSVSWGDDGYVASLMTEMTAILYDIYHADEEMIELLNSLISEVDSVEEFLSAIQQAQNTTNDLLDDILTYIKRLYDEQYKSNGWLRSIYEYLLNFKGESTFEEPNTESISDYDKAEDELVSGADDTSDIEQQIEDFEIDTEASGKIWDIITQFFNCHPKIMGLVIGILCLGIIALILNR